MLATRFSGRVCVSLVGSVFLLALFSVWPVPLDAQGGPSGFISDDFNTCTIAGGPTGWTFSDPVGGATARTVGAGSGNAWLEISMPAGASRDSWNANYSSPRLMRPIANTDFTIEVRFLSQLTQGYQDQGIFIEQDPLNYLRFDFFHDGGAVRVFGARTTAGASSVEA